VGDIGGRAQGPASHAAPGLLFGPGTTGMVLLLGLGLGLRTGLELALRGPGVPRVGTSSRASQQVHHSSRE